jgi:predicted amidohydrolase
MARIVTIAIAQLGATQGSDTRQAVVARMLDLMDQAKSQGADFIVYPELALTTFFLMGPHWCTLEVSANGGRVNDAGCDCSGR